MGTKLHKDLTGSDLHIPFLVGNDADKASSPSGGDWYFAIDTGKMYRCVTAGTWEQFGGEAAHVVGTGTPVADRTISIKIGGVTYYLVASTTPT